MLSAALLIFPLILVVPIAFYLAIWVATTTHPSGARHLLRGGSPGHDPISFQRDAVRLSARVDPLERAGRCRRMARLFTPEAAEALSALAREFEREARGRASNR